MGTHPIALGRSSGVDKLWRQRGGEGRRGAARGRVPTSGSNGVSNGGTSPSSHSRARRACVTDVMSPASRRRREPSSYYPRGRHRSPRDDTVSARGHGHEVPLGPPSSHPALTDSRVQPAAKLDDDEGDRQPQPSRPRLGHSCMPCTSRLGASTSILIMKKYAAWARHWCRPASSSSNLHRRHCVSIVKTAAYRKAYRNTAAAALSSMSTSGAARRGCCQLVGTAHHAIRCSSAGYGGA